MSAATRTGPVTLFGHDPATYLPHPVHGGEDAYGETNCYSDILIELLHARGDEPVAAMGTTLRLDFEGDQWTFFKPPPGDLELLFGVDVHEMQPLGDLPAQIEDQLRRGRTLIVELDAFHLPDTAATSYRGEHVKTSVAMEAIDPGAQRLRYFHNGGLHELEGADYEQVLRVRDGWQGEVLPPYTELVRFDAGPRLEGDVLREAARGLLAHHLARRPATDPFARFGDQLGDDLPRLLAGDAADYHAYAFATVRMAGAGFGLAARHVRWLLGKDGELAAERLGLIVDGCKLLSFKLARRRAFDPEPAIATLSEAWQEAMTSLDAAAR